jgi:hypothetical protein
MRYIVKLVIMQSIQGMFIVGGSHMIDTVSECISNGLVPQ